ncbi:MAG: DNA methyltransferase, partial [Phycisphaerae bacterium]
MSLPTTADRSLPRIEVPITLGNVRNGHVYVRDFLWFFPKSAIRGNRLDRSEARPCTLELADFGIVQSEIDAAKGIFRWRGWKRFFRQHSVGEGDCLVFSRIGRNRFSVTVKHVALEGLAAAGSTPASDKRQSRTPATQRRRCNDLSGDEWLRCSLSVWSDIRKSLEEAQLDHPAMFPTMLCERLISMFLRRRGQHKVLDPFVGSGSTLLAARNLGKVGIGLEVNESYVKLARRRLE